jgi:hypothetical protein
MTALHTQAHIWTKKNNLKSGVRLKQRIRFPLFERHFRRISVFRGASRRGGGGEYYYTLAGHYGERIRCFTHALKNACISILKNI